MADKNQQEAKRNSNNQFSSSTTLGNTSPSKWRRQRSHGQLCRSLRKLESQSQPYRSITAQQDMSIKALDCPQWQLQMRRQDQHYNHFSTNPRICSNQQLSVALEAFSFKQKTHQIPTPSNSYRTTLYSRKSFLPRFSNT